jgi:hypothetical protein
LRPVSSACLVGEHSAVVWKRLNFRPLAASFSAFGVRRLAGAAEGARGAESGVVDEDDQDVGCAFRWPQLLDRREFAVGILRVVRDEA